MCRKFIFLHQNMQKSDKLSRKDLEVTFRIVIFALRKCDNGRRDDGCYTRLINLTNLNPTPPDFKSRGAFFSADQ